VALASIKNAFATIAVILLLALGLYSSIYNLKHPADDPVMSIFVRPSPVVKSICVAPIQNFSHELVAVDGFDDELVVELHKAGFESRKIADGGQCDATTNAEVVDIFGGGRKTARVHFRFTLTRDQAPRISSWVEGKSGGKSDDPLEKSMNEFAVAPDTKENPDAAREAIEAALGKTVAQIRGAIR
jgi:hypothetical protein